MPRFMVCVEFKVPKYVHVEVEAETAESAVKAAKKFENSGVAFWEQADLDYDSCTDTTFEVVTYDPSPDFVIDSDGNETADDESA